MVYTSHNHLLSLLKTHFGYDVFRHPQLDVINSILAGQDTFALMPTGAGKSLCFQMPSLVLPGLTVVISPLIALMKDQVDHLTAHGIPAGCVNSSMSRSELVEIAQRVNAGEIQLLYLSPERLAIARFNQWLQRKNVTMIAIDEAHCISEWGHDFRPEYKALTQLKQMFPNVPIIALTATAVPQVRKEIVSLLQLDKPNTFQTSFNRPNLHYIVRRDVDRWGELLSWVQKYQGESVVIYCLSRKKTEQVASDLTQAGIKASAYHAGFPSDKRTKIQDDFLKDRVQVIVATIAFGMGIDKPNIRLVIHFDLPKSLEGYYQETGRAGRDGLLSHCVLFVDDGSPAVYRRFMRKIEDPQARKVSEQKLEQMVTFAQKNHCRRKAVLAYFAEPFTAKNCESCDYCLAEYQAFPKNSSKERALEYHPDVLDRLKVLRLKLAEIEGVPAFVIFGDQSLLEMATYLPQSEKEFSDITGVGTFKLEKYGPVFIKLLKQMSEKFDLKKVKKPKKTRVQKMPSITSGSTHAETKRLLDSGKSLEYIAKKRKLKLGTIIDHLEKIIKVYPDFNFGHLKPEAERFEQIEDAFNEKGLEKLAPVKAVLGDDFSYDELKLVRVFLRAG